MNFNKTTCLGMTSIFMLALTAATPALSWVGMTIADRVHSVPYAEPGNWWDISRPGEGLVLERQKNTISLILFTYTADGQPDFYLASAPLTVYLSMVTPPLTVGAASNYFIAEGTLFRFKNGPVLNSSLSYFAGDPPSSVAEPVGKINASIQPFSNALRVKITLDEDKVPEGSEQTTIRHYHKSSFGYAGLGNYISPEDAPAPYQASRPCWVDLRGRWVFVDSSSPTARDAWSFNFTELETTPAPEEMSCISDWRATIRADHSLLYRDTETGATLHCVAKDAPILELRSDYQIEDHRCILRSAENEPLLWFSINDIGVKQIIGTLGAPPNDSRTWRGLYDERVMGLRVD